MTDSLDKVLKAAVSEIKTASLSLKDVLKLLHPQSLGEENPPSDPPLPAVITHDEKEALDRLHEVYGSVVPTERRELQAPEVDKILEEKGTLDTVKKLIERRHTGIRATIFNHLDVEAEKAGIAANADRDGNGFYILEGVAAGDNPNQVFKREVREGSPQLSVTELEALADSDEFPEFTRKDYLAMTTQTRVFDEHKAMLALKKNPDLVRVFARAASPGKKTASMYVRKR